MRNLNMRRQIQRPRPSINTQSVSIKKLVSASNRMGNKGIKDQQMTTVEYFDYLPYAPGTTLNFFENVNARSFPFTNLTQNELQTGESMVIKRIWFTVATQVAGNITNIQTFEQAALTGQYLSQFAWFNDNVRVLKPMSLTQFQAEFNRKGWNTDNNVMHLETDITIMPLIKFSSTLRLVPGAAVANLFIGCHIGGMGTILSPKGTY